MDDVSRAKRNVGIHLGMWSVLICMAAGLIMEFRPLVILERAVASFTVSMMLGYMLISVIQRYSDLRGASPPAEAGSGGAKADAKKADATRSRDDQKG